LNVVFDLGGVVISWKPDQILRKVFEGREIQKRVKVEILSHPDWVDLDRGILSWDELINRATIRTKIPRATISQLMQQIPPSLIPDEDTLRIIKSLKNDGNKVFVLSNIPKVSLEYLEREYSFLELFDGVVASCRIQMVKPEAKIYEHLLSEFKLNPKETIFIDDLEINLIEAMKLGIKTIHFQNPHQCEDELRALGCFS
jgi:putative hydrolase of the HAD superfamily